MVRCSFPLVVLGTANRVSPTDWGNPAPVKGSPNLGHCVLIHRCHPTGPSSFWSTFVPWHVCFETRSSPVEQQDWTVQCYNSGKNKSEVMFDRGAMRMKFTHEAYLPLWEPKVHRKLCFSSDGDVTVKMKLLLQFKPLMIGIHHSIFLFCSCFTCKCTKQMVLVCSC